MQETLKMKETHSRSNEHHYVLVCRVFTHSTSISMYIHKFVQCHIHAFGTCVYIRCMCAYHTSPYYPVGSPLWQSTRRAVHAIVTVSVDTVLENAPLMSAGPLLQ